MKKRLLCILLACALLIVPAVRPARAAGTGATIGIIGGAIGTGGAAGGIAAGSVLLPVLGVVGAVLAAYGINVALTDASQEAGLTKTQFIYSKIGEFCDFAGVDKNALVQGIATGIKVGSSGNIILDAAGGAVVSQFVDFLFSRGDIVSDIPSDDSVSINGYSFVLNDCYFGRSSSNFTKVRLYSGESVYFCITDNPGSPLYPYCVLALSFSPGVQIAQYRDDGFVFTPQALSNTVINNDGQTLYYRITGSQSAIANVNSYTNLPYHPDLLGNLSSSVIGSPSVPVTDDVFTGNDALWEENKDLLKPGSDDTISINPDLLNPVIDSAAAGDYTATVPDYLTALAHALDRADAAEVALPVTNVATGAAVPLAVPDTAVASPAITNVAATSPDVVGAGALADPAIPISPGDAVPALQFDLAEIFPFCIPFDLVDMVTLLRADPVTPKFHLAWTFPIVNAPVEFDVDLSQFDDIAAIVRPFELLIFVIGLALTTRDLIRG